ncbi:MAG TPA: hypothetical protein VK061_03440 [Bacillota bacterium]|nr:hypothetical protein [Bacillota bacterium]
MKRHFIQFYRKSDLYTLYYSEKDGKLYKIPFKKKASYSEIYVLIITFVIIERVLRSLYEIYSTLLIDFGLIVLGVILAKKWAVKLYRDYYDFDNIQVMDWLEPNFLRQCVDQGLKQSQIESLALILSLILGLGAFSLIFIVEIFFFIILGSLSLVCYFTLQYIQPLRRKKIAKKIILKYDI